MTVIINEFEIDVEPPQPEQAAGEAETTASQEPNQPAPMDLRDVQQWYERRQMRVWAH